MPFSLLFFPYNKLKKNKEKRKKTQTQNLKNQLAQCPCILCFPDTPVWNNGSCAWIRAEDCWTWPLSDFFLLTIVTFIQRSQRVCSIYHTGQTFETVWAEGGQSPLLQLSVLSLAVWETNEFLKISYTLFGFTGWLVRYCKVLYFVFLRSDDSFSFLHALSGVCFSSWFIYYPSLCN